VNIVKLFPKRVSQIYLRLSIITGLPIFISLFTKSLCLGLGYPIVHEKNAPKGKPFETRARILLEIMKEPLSRTRLKERLNDVSTKTIDYHIQRAGDSLLNLKIVSEKNNRLTVTLRDAESLAKISRVLSAHQEKGSVIENAINLAFIECFISPFGSHAEIVRILNPDYLEAVISTKLYLLKRDFPGNNNDPNYDLQLDKDNISIILKLAQDIYGKLDLSFKVNYIITVIGNTRKAIECYLVSKSRNYNYLDSSGANKDFKERVRKGVSDMPSCQLSDFTNWYRTPWGIEKEAENISFLFPEIVQLFYYRVLYDPLFKGQTPFKLIDTEIIKDPETLKALYYTNMLLFSIITDNQADISYDPFQSGMIQRTISNEESLEHLATFLTTKPFLEEYTKWKSERLNDWVSGKIYKS